MAVIAGFVFMRYQEKKSQMKQDAANDVGGVATMSSSDESAAQDSSGDEREPAAKSKIGDREASTAVREVPV